MASVSVTTVALLMTNGKSYDKIVLTIIAISGVLYMVKMSGTAVRTNGL